MNNIKEQSPEAIHAQLKATACSLGDIIINREAHLLPPDDHKSLYHSSLINIHSGTSGVLIFLIELYRQTGESKYMVAVEKGLDQIISYSSEHKTLNYSFMTGNLGLSYALLQYYKISKNQEYLSHACHIASKCGDEYLNNLYTNNNLYSGRAGSILVLLHLYDTVQEDWILSLINLHVKAIIEDARYTGESIGWVSPNGQQQNESGFTYGGAGIAYAFLELGNYTGNDIFYLFAKMAFAWEDSHWNENLQRWDILDLSIRDSNIYHTYKTRFTKNNTGAILEPSAGINATQPGIGIVFAQLRAIELLEDTQSLHRIRYLLDKASSQNAMTGSLVEGKLSYGTLFLEAFRCLRETTFLHSAQQHALALAITHQYQNMDVIPVDKSLLKGIAGIGYFLLQTIDPLNTSSIMLPRLEATAQKKSSAFSLYPFLDLSLIEARRLLLKKIFGRTIAMLETIDIHAIMNYFRTPLNDEETEVAQFYYFIERQLKVIDERYQKNLESIYALERKKLEICIGIENEAALHIKEILRYEKLEQSFHELTALEFQNALVSINPSVTFIETWCDPFIQSDEELNENFLTEGKRHTVLLRPTTERFILRDVRKTTRENLPPFNQGKVFELNLDETQKLILSLLDEPKSIKNLIKEMSRDLRFESMETSLVQDLLLLEIKEDLVTGILSFHDYEQH